ncbi:hypothetical protein FAZ15_12000 [Sphingobacterium olei]|uniref:Substrate import-associated zinc metallohydrolase lipoprotein n=1 Tax=Sphingobacterium olei TaxID=2571155 RepID=A0A4U0P0G7_9SPHI|nr:substrate import-associated zinc metallohydrolase lipoprotein [Sphingobacterium olei]TJZ60701.1 hypothetical protein FAZ15_12000 [Sphingobacterium olei]
MKIKLIHILAIASLIGLAACNKSDENLDVDLSQYNYDNFQKTEIDDYLYNTLTKPYNIEVVYRFDRSHTDIAKNISPPNIEKVKPAADMILKGFLKPYELLGGEEMIKTYTPKQFVLFGSHAYNDNGSVTLGTADGGRRVVLYDVNNISELQGNDIKRRLRTIHHEFTHILNQMVAIPPSFRTITADHVDNWLAAENTEAEAKRLGFVSRYARSNFGEDFAEMVAHLLIEGQVWFDNYVAGIEEQEYRDRIRLKESVVREYFNSYFNINFGELQAEMYRVLTEEYNATFPEDITLTFGYQLAMNRVSTITIDPTAAHYTTYGSSAAFNTMLTNYNNAMVAAGWRMRTMQLMFTTTPGKMTLRIGFTTATTTTPVYNGDYDFSYTVNATNGLITFTKMLPEGTGATYNNGRETRLPPFEQFLLPYLTGRQFIANYLPTGITPDSPLYRTFAGFRENGVATNYFYGPVIYR